MGRALLLFQEWERVDEGALELEKALLFDFVLQNPRLFLAALTDLDPVLRAYGLQDAGISEFFAQRRLHTARERFQSTVSDLVARDLLHEHFAMPPTESAAFRLTELGKSTATLFTSEMADGIRSVAAVTCTQWRRRNSSELHRLIRQTLPDQSSEAARLTDPFAAWLLDVE
jgi:hypothetical protein